VGEGSGVSCSQAAAGQVSDFCAALLGAPGSHIGAPAVAGYGDQQEQ